VAIAGSGSRDSRITASRFARVGGRGPPRGRRGSAGGGGTGSPKSGRSPAVGRCPNEGGSPDDGQPGAPSCRLLPYAGGCGCQVSSGSGSPASSGPGMSMSAQTDLALAGTERAGPAVGSSADGAAGVTAGSADPGSAGQSCSLLAKVVHPRLSSVREWRAWRGADRLRPSLGHRIANGTLSYVTDTG